MKRIISALVILLALLFGAALSITHMRKTIRAEIRRANQLARGLFGRTTEFGARSRNRTGTEGLASEGF